MTTRILGLGNDLLADDAFGVEVVRLLAGHLPEHVEVRSSIASGFALLDDVLGADRLIVVDTVTGTGAEPGSVSRFEDGDVSCVPGVGPHYVGLFETLRWARALALPAPRQVAIFTVEAADCLTVGGPMTPSVRAALPTVARMIEEQVGEWSLVPCP